MIQVHPNLFVGSQDDYEMRRDDFGSWMVIHACKEPYHRQASNAVSRANSYLGIDRGHRLIDSPSRL